MPIGSKYIFMASMNVEPEKEELFNEVYDEEHVPYLLEVPGVHAVTRVMGEDFAIAIAGGVQEKAHEGPIHTAIYEIDGPEVLKSEAWAEAVERGRWAEEVRPYTKDRAHHMYKVR